MLLRQTSFRALAEPRWFRDADGTVSDGTLRVRFGEVEARGVALTPRAANATTPPWRAILPRRGATTSRPPTPRWQRGLAYYRGGDPAKPVVYEDFLPASAAGIFRSNLDADAPGRRAADDPHYSLDWMAGAIGHHIHDPYDLYEKAASYDHHATSHAPHRRRPSRPVRAALQAIGADRRLGEPGGAGLQASTPITGDVLFTVAETTAEQADAAIAAAAQAFTAWRTTPAPVRGALVARLGELLIEHKADLATLVTVEAGKITSEALGEVQEMIDICQFAVGLSRQLYGKTIASERPGHRLMETWHPLGVVGVITAFNFPVAVWAWNTAVALVCGDTVVWKPSELTPLTAMACQALIERAAADVGAPRERQPAHPGRPRDRRAAGRRPPGRAGERDRLGADGPAGRPAGGAAVRQGAARTRRQQRRHRHAVGRSRPRGARHRVLGGGHGGPAVHHACAA